MATFVLVHGAWQGAWCWDAVAPRLRERVAVVTPTLTGLGERAVDLSPDVDLDRHVQDVLAILDEQSGPVILVGHSYGGMVITGVAAAVPDRVVRIVYLDAFVPQEGKSLFDLLRPERRQIYERSAIEHGDGWRVPAPAAELFGVDGEIARVLATKLCDQPLRTFTQPFQPADSGLCAIPRTYIHCTTGPLVRTFTGFAAQFRAARMPGYYELATGHEAMLTAPEALSAILYSLAELEIV